MKSKEKLKMNAKNKISRIRERETWKIVDC